jgi:hypothetical protein
MLEFEARGRRREEMPDTAGSRWVVQSVTWLANHETPAR